MSEQKTNNKNKNTKRGGKRKGAGRKRIGDSRVIDTTKVIRVSYDDYEYLKSNLYADLLNLVFEYREILETTPSAKTSPRWAKMRQFIKDFEAISSSAQNTKMK